MEHLNETQGYLKEDLHQLLQKTAMAYPVFIKKIESKINKDAKENTLFFSQDEAFQIIEKQILLLKQKKQLKAFCLQNAINYESLNVLRWKMNKDHDTGHAPKLFLQLLKIFYKDVEMKKEVYYVITNDEKK